MRHDPWAVSAYAGLLLLLGWVVAFSRDAGLIWDEWLHVEYGERILRWFGSRFHDNGALHYRNLYLYGGLFDAPAQWLARRSPLGVYETRHVLSAVVAALGVIAAYRIAARLGGSRAGFLAGATLFLTPAWTGHGLFNPKDIPFGTAAAFTCYASVAIAMGPALLSWRAALFGGLCVGAAVGVRSGGLFLFGYVACTAYGRALLDIVTRSGRRETLRGLRLVGQVTLRLCAAAALAWGLMLSFWPWAQVSPWRRPLEGARRAARFRWAGDVLFEGHVFVPTDLPYSYLPKWFAMTLPEFYLVALLAGLLALAVALRARPRAWISPKGLALAFLVGSVGAPLIGAMVMRAGVYDAHRHFLFLMPPLAALAGVALSGGLDLLRSRQARVALLAVWLAGASVTARDMIAMHPYEYTYFNRLSGGLRAAAGRFEIDYWGASYEAGLAWLVQHVPKSRKVFRVANCSVPAQTEYYLERWAKAGEHFRFTENRKRADFLLATTRYGCHKAEGEVLHTVEREGVPLLYVIRLRHRGSR